MIEIELANRQSRHAVDAARLTSAARCVLEGEGVPRAEISLAVVDDPTIRQLNRQYLAHDYATDVLSFVLERQAGHLQGEVIVSADTAATAAAEFGVTPGDELLLYVIHGLLHLVGYDDKSVAARQKMRQRERHYLQRCGVVLPADTRRPSSDAQADRQQQGSDPQ